MVTNQAAISPRHAQLFADYLAAMRAMTDDTRIGAYNATSILYGYNSLLVSLRVSEMGALRRVAANDYLNVAVNQASRAPYREDSVTPYLRALWELESDTEHTKLMAAVQALLAANPHHRSALWLGGKVLSTQPGYENEGRAMMQDALKLGADKVYAIPKTEIDALQTK